MSNRRELKKYRRKADDAQWTLEQVEALPRRVGSLIQWGASNGVIWRRIGDDLWVPLHANHGYEPQEPYGVFPSDHVAVTWQGWTRIKRLPVLPTTETEEQK